MAFVVNGGAKTSISGELKRRKVTWKTSSGLFLKKCAHFPRKHLYFCYSELNL